MDAPFDASFSSNGSVHVVRCCRLSGLLVRQLSWPLACMEIRYDRSDPTLADSLTTGRPIWPASVETGRPLVRSVETPRPLAVSSSGRRRGERAGCSGSHARPSYRPATFSALTSTASYPRPPGRPLDS